MLINPVRVRNILVARNDRFGEFLLNIPALRALKETFPNASITALVNPSVRELAGCISYIDEVIEWDPEKRSFLEKLRMLKSKKPDIAVMLNPSKELNILTYLSGIPVRAGYDRKWGFLLTHKMRDNKGLGLKHEVEYNLELVSLVGAKTTDKTISLDRMPLSLNSEYAGAVAVHPFTSDPVKQWPAERFQELAERIAGNLKVKVIFVGRTNQGGTVLFENRPHILPGTVPVAMDLINKTSLVELAQILKQCKLLISGDSGPMHLASAVGTPVIALFRNDIPGKSPPRWGPKNTNSIVIQKSSLLDISVEEVFNKVREALKI
ncbi:MAG: glycosyltransferase family 9 protein [Candidatus Omnitrophota bacterium]